MFVLVGDHLYSPRELRHAYYYDKVLFSSNKDCLHVAWQDSDHLVISCDGTQIESHFINVEKQTQNGFTVRYRNIALKAK